MSYDGTCTFIFICSGPSAQAINLSNHSIASQFDLSDGSGQTKAIDSGPGLYGIKISPGSDTAKWSVEVQDYY
jgi:hypothetical protein